MKHAHRVNVKIGALIVAMSATALAGPKESSLINTIPVELRVGCADVAVGDTFSVEVTAGLPLSLKRVDVRISYDRDQLQCFSVPREESEPEFRRLKRVVDSKKGAAVYTAESGADRQISDPEGSICSFSFLALRTGQADLVWRCFGVTMAKGSDPGVPFSLRATSVVIAEKKETITNMSLPDCFDLSHNFPNPFNPETRITYQLPVPSHIRLTVFNILGQEIRTIVNGEQSPGYHTVLWDGRDDRGAEVASGTYFYRMETETYTKVQRMTLLR